MVHPTLEIRSSVGLSKGSFAHAACHSLTIHQPKRCFPPVVSHLPTALSVLCWPRGTQERWFSQAQADATLLRKGMRFGPTLNLGSFQTKPGNCLGKREAVGWINTEMWYRSEWPEGTP